MVYCNTPPVFTPRVYSILRESKLRESILREIIYSARIDAAQLYERKTTILSTCRCGVDNNKNMWGLRPHTAK